MYTDFALIYDRLMEDVPYEQWAAHYLELLDKYGAKGKKCTECACGTGKLTIPLQKNGMQMTGIDLSGDMLQLAMKNARNAGVTIPFVRQNMCELTLPGRTNAILCTCDGLNYLTKKSDVQQFFRRAFEALKPGGVLLFDVSTPYKLSCVLGNTTRTFVSGDYCYIWNNHFTPQNACVRMNLSIFTKNEDQTYTRTEEFQRQRAHSREELKAWLEETGFGRIRFFGNMRMTAPRDQDMRWHVAALKPGK